MKTPLSRENLLCAFATIHIVREISSIIIKSYGVIKMTLDNEKCIDGGAKLHARGCFGEIRFYFLISKVWKMTIEAGYGKGELVGDM